MHYLLEFEHLNAVSHLRNSSILPQSFPALAGGDTVQPLQLLSEAGPVSQTAFRSFVSAQTDFFLCV